MTRVSPACFMVAVAMGLLPAAGMAQSVATGTITGVVRDYVRRRAPRRDRGSRQPGADRKGPVGGHRRAGRLPDHRSASRHLYGHVHAARLQHVAS